MTIDTTLQQRYKEEPEQPSTLVRIPIANAETTPPEPPIGLKCVLPQRELEQALTLVCKSIPRRRSCVFRVLIDAGSDSIRLSTTDATSGIVATLPARIEGMGSWAVNAKLLFSCIKTFSSGQSVTLEVQDGDLVVWSSTRSFVLKCGGQDFPDLQLSMPLPFYCTVNSGDLRKATRSVNFAADEYAVRLIFTSVGLHLQSESCQFIAADGTQLAQCSLPLEKMEGRDAMLQIPVSTMRLLLQTLPKKDTQVAFRWSSERAEFEYGNVRLITSLILETFPDISIHNVPKTTFTLQRLPLLSLLKAFKPITEGSAHILRLSYQSGGAAVVFSASCDGLASACDGLEAQVHGESGQIIFNARYLMSLVDALPDEALTFSISGPDTPCFVLPVRRESCYQYLMMPMQTNGR